MIYHIVTASALLANLQGGFYSPPTLVEDGFVHCSAKVSVLAVANDYFAGESEQVLLLEIDPDKLTSALRYERAAPIPGGGTSHLAVEESFPHVYGPIDKGAIVGVGVLDKTPNGYRWPIAFVPLDSYESA